MYSMYCVQSRAKQCNALASRGTKSSAGSGDIPSSWQPEAATFVGGKKGRKSNYSQGDPPDSHMNKAIISRARFTPDDFPWVREAAAAENLQIEGGSVLEGNVALLHVCT